MTEQVSYRRYSGTAAENYERYFVPAIARPVAADLLRAANLQLGERVLDVACGTGIIARLAAEQVGSTGKVFGIDFASDMIDVARATAASSEPRIEWRQGDAAALPFPDGSFDVVLCQMGVMLFADKPAALSEMRRVLVAGGRLALNTPGAINRPMALLADALARHIDPNLAGFVRAVFSMDDPSEHEQVLRASGFTDVEATVVTATLHLPPPRDFLWQYINLTPLGAVVNEAPEAAQAAIEHDVVDEWQAVVEDSGGAVDQPMVVATGTAAAT
jgi:ubiquinone/menaquinone biosynthesis C-methylase UbiE